MNNNVLRQNIIDELEFEPSIDAANIGIAVDNGVVTLTGHVSTYAQKAATEEAVRRVKGVKGIAEEIEDAVIGGEPVGAGPFDRLRDQRAVMAGRTR